jgi:hypothetical protein
MLLSAAAPHLDPLFACGERESGADTGGTASAAMRFSFMMESVHREMLCRIGATLASATDHVAREPLPERLVVLLLLLASNELDDGPKDQGNGR